MEVMPHQAEPASATDAIQSMARPRPKVSFSSGQGFDSNPTFDFERVAHHKLLLGSWLSIAFFIAFIGWCSLFQIRDHVMAQGVLYWAIVGAVWACVCSWGLCVARRRALGVAFMYRLMHSLLGVTVIFLILFQSNQLRVFHQRTAKADGPFTGAFEHIGLSVVLASFALLVAYGVFVPDPDSQQTSNSARNRGGWIRRFFVPRPGIYLNPVLHFVALFPLLAIGVFGVWTGTLPQFVGPMCQMAIWLWLGWSIAFLGPMRLEYRESLSLQERINQSRYDLKETLGAGRMGEVSLVYDRLVKRHCAIKTIRQDFIGVPEAVQRFQCEVGATATLDHPNIVRVYDFGENSDGSYYCTLEYVPGLTLEKLVRDSGPLPPGRVVHLLRQLCQALRTAHAVGLIHRDIKPANIMVARPLGMDEVAKLLDFGLALDTGTLTTPGATHGENMSGTPAYMSPEQAADETLDHRTDIYSLGGVAYFLLTGSPPFSDKKNWQALVAHYDEPVIRPTDRRPGIPKDIEAVVMQALSKRRECRYQNARSLERALAECVCASEWQEEQMDEWWRLQPELDRRLPPDAIRSDSF